MMQKKIRNVDEKNMQKICFVCEKRNLLNWGQRNTFEKIDIQCKQA